MQKKSNYKDTYYTLVTQENLEPIKVIMKDHDYYNSSTIDKIQYCELDGLPHFSLIVDSPKYTDGNYAMLDGIYLNVSSLIPQWHGIFYLSIVIVRKPTNEKVKRFVNLRNDIEHELNHLQWLINHINKFPDYIEKSMKYNVGSCEVTYLPQSIMFEVRKIFSMEIPALIMDFDKGEKYLLSYNKGIVTKITVNDKDIFLRYKVGQYLAELNNRYAKRFPENVDQIKQNLEKEVNRQGKEVFGNNCMMLLMMSLVQYLHKLEAEGVSCEIGEI